MRNRFTFLPVLIISLLVGVAPVYGNIVIIPGFEPSLISLPGAAPVESTIDYAIAFYEANISTQITVNIAFGVTTKASFVGESVWYYDSLSYKTFITDLQAVSRMGPL